MSKKRERPFGVVPSLRFLIIPTTAMFYGDVLVAVHQDITDRKQAEAKLEQLNRELEQHIAERTATSLLPTPYFSLTIVGHCDGDDRTGLVMINTISSATILTTSIRP